MNAARSDAFRQPPDFVRIRGLRYHVRRWGPEKAPKLFLLHGWLDVSATWEPMVRELLRVTGNGWQVLAPDWRGFGFSEWPADGYWFPDYVADLDALLDHYTADPATLVGHSMGGQIASLYAGLRPKRVGRLVCLDSLFMPDMPARDAPRRLRRWLDQVKAPSVEKTYASFEDLAGRILRMHPRVSPERARFIAECWGRADGHGRITLCADPKHRLDGPALYRSAEAEAIWGEVTAPTCFIDAAESEFLRAIATEENTRRRGCFRTRTSDLIAGAGHMLHFDAPEATARSIAEFLGRQQA